MSESYESLRALLAGAGYGFVEPPIVHPARVFVELAGEELRRRLYLTSGADGAELALRPDFTIPVALHHLATGAAKRKANYAYLGPVFRIRGEGPGEAVRGADEHLAGGARPAEDRGAVPVRLRGRLAAVGVTDGVPLSARKPEWMRVPVRSTPGSLGLRRTLRELDLVTVCEEAGCPNLSECWSDGTATFMISGERCTRACGFCLVDTRKPEPADPGEPERVAEAVDRMGLDHAVVTAVARDDLADGGAGAFAATIAAIRRRRPSTRVEVLIPDCKGDLDSLATIFDARPDVLNHNLETVARLQRAVRPSAGYARSLAVLARAEAAGLVTKSGLIVGMGETDDEVVGALADLRAVGVDIVTVGQYLRPTSHHLPVARWWTPDELAELKRVGEAMGIGHVEASPLTRSSYHAKQAARSVAPPSIAAEA